jgi:ubiquinone/menaquinone biosynthesis C-methylase UbiE
VGCGPGWNYDHFKQYGPKVKWYKGLDYSERFVRVANARHGVKHDNFCDPAPFELGDCRDLKESDNSWDVVILQDCLEHTNGYEKPVKEALRVAKKRVIVSFWHLTENDDHINDDGKDGWGAWYSKPKWEEFLNSLPNVTWMDLDINANDRVRNFYVIRKEGDDE